MARRTAYKELRDANPDLGLPAADSASAVEEAMPAWERDHPADLEEAEVSDTNFTA